MTKKFVIDDCQPYTETIEFVVKAGQSPVVGEITNRHFERIREFSKIAVRLTALADATVPDPQPTVLDRFVKIGLHDMSRNLPIATVALREDPKQTAGLALRPVGDSVYEWTPRVPLRLYRNDTLQIQVVPRETFQLTIRNERRVIDAIRVEISLEGVCALMQDVALVGSHVGATVVTDQ